MGLLSALNPFSFGRKHQAAWNALMASHTYQHLNATQQQLVLNRVRTIVEGQMHRPLEEFLKNHNRIVFRPS